MGHWWNLCADSCSTFWIPEEARIPLLPTEGPWHKLDRCLVDDGFSQCVGQVFVVMAAMLDSEMTVRIFPVQMPSGMRYWTVIGDDLLVCLWRMHICGMCGSDQATELKNAPASSATCSGHSHKTG